MSNLSAVNHFLYHSRAKTAHLDVHDLAYVLGPYGVPFDPVAANKRADVVHQRRMAWLQSHEYAMQLLARIPLRPLHLH